MRTRDLKYVLALSCGLLAVSANAVGLTYNGGPLIKVAKVVNIYWGPSFANAASPDYQYAQTLIAFRNQLGASSEWAALGQYGIKPSDLGAGTPDWFDTSVPPTNVTDTTVRAEVQRYLASHAVDVNTVYEVFLPASSYSSHGTSTSCGGPSLSYCGYHDFFTSGSTAAKYTVQAYPSCGGCKISGWTPAQNQEHVVNIQTINTVTDPMGDGWRDNTGREVADLCAWSPTPYVGANGFTYIYLWQSSSGSCIRTR
ncbi:MAG: hypothetical protein QOF89_5312 [Acidobacteriota bacterium]|jgi:hypothetical protein|nr:hypothetical protein [Acidobacteriota bacterium]